MDALFIFQLLPMLLVGPAWPLTAPAAAAQAAASPILTATAVGHMIHGE